MHGEDEDFAACSVSKFGFNLMNKYEHRGKLTEIMEVMYNSRTHKFILLDTRGATCWAPGSHTTHRELTYPKYHNKLLKQIIFCEKHNNYFAVCSDFSLQVYSKDFIPTCKTGNPHMRSILHILFNPTTDELITTGMAGTTILKYQHVEGATYDQMKPMANYSLVEKLQRPHVGGLWCTTVRLINRLQQLYFCSENDLFAYSASDLKHLFTIKNAHGSSLTCAGYSAVSRLLVTGGADAQVKVWGSNGGHIHTFRGHVKPVSCLLVPDTWSGVVMSGSMDGSVRVWSLDMMDLLHSYNVFHAGISWMGVTSAGHVWCANHKQLVVLRYNEVAEYWGHARCKVNWLELVGSNDKSTRLMAIGEDGSVRLFKQQRRASSAVCTVLPAPIVSLLSTLLGVAYTRHNNLFYMLVSHHCVWVYTGRTDPACRLYEWKVADMRKSNPMISPGNPHEPHDPCVTPPTKQPPSHVGPEGPGCNCIAVVYSPEGVCYQAQHGLCCAKSRHLLVLGTSDGKLIFVDQLVGRRYFEMSINKGAVHSLAQAGGRIITKCGDSLQIWSLPMLAKMWATDMSHDLTIYKLHDEYLLSGLNNGGLMLTTIRGTQASCDDIIQLSPPHNQRVTNVEISMDSSIFISTSIDGLIKVWSLHDHSLLHEILLDESLSSSSFLNIRNDLIIGWKNHLFRIDQSHLSRTACPASSNTSQLMDCDSDIYEDPTLREDNTPVVKPINLHNYLVPYDFVLADETSPCNNGEAAVEVEEAPDDTTSSIHAPTLILLSPSSSYNSINLIESLLHLPTSKTTRTDMMFPECGDSPSPSPAPSMSSDEEIEVDSSSEVGTIIQEQIMEEEASSSHRSSKSSSASSVRLEVDPELPSEVQPLSSRLSGMRIDARSMMKRAISAVVAAQKFKNSPHPGGEEEEEVRKPRARSAVVKKSRARPYTSDRTNISEMMSNSELIGNNINEQTLVVKGPTEGNISIPSKYQGRGSQNATSTKLHDQTSKPLGFRVKRFSRTAVQGRRTVNLSRKKSKSAGKLNSHKSPQAIPEFRNLAQSVSGGGVVHSEVPSDTKPTTQIKSATSSVNRGVMEGYSRSVEGHLRSTGGHSRSAEGHSRGSRRNMRSKSSSSQRSDHRPHVDETTDLTEFDFQAIYKKDGLQFDESWQERMLDRYLLMKMQREQRHLAAANKRLQLQNERQYKMLSHSPELVYHDAYQWYKEHQWPQEHNTSECVIKPHTSIDDVIMKRKSRIAFANLSTGCMDSPAGAPPSEVDCADFRPPDGNIRKFRFSIRPTSDETSSDISEDAPIPTPPTTPLPKQSMVSFKPSHSATSRHKLVLDRPRSSTSIPSKTRYILLKPDGSTVPTRSPSPTKLEEDLLRKRFPAQHRSLMRMFGKPLADNIRSEGGDNEASSRDTRRHRSEPQMSGTRIRSSTQPTKDDHVTAIRTTSLHRGTPRFAAF